MVLDGTRHLYDLDRTEELLGETVAGVYLVVAFARNAYGSEQVAFFAVRENVDGRVHLKGIVGYTLHKPL